MFCSFLGFCGIFTITFVFLGGFVLPHLGPALESKWQAAVFVLRASRHTNVSLLVVKIVVHQHIGMALNASCKY